MSRLSVSRVETIAELAHSFRTVTKCEYQVAVFSDWKAGLKTAQRCGNSRLDDEVGYIATSGVSISPPPLSLSPAPLHNKTVVGKTEEMMVKRGRGQVIALSETVSIESRVGSLTFVRTKQAIERDMPAYIEGIYNERWVLRGTGRIAASAPSDVPPPTDRQRHWLAY